jgi:hypothetical protein
MPNKTIYIKDSDLPLWDRAQRELGESISSVFADHLKERLEVETSRKRAKKAGRVEEVQAMNSLLAEVNAELNLDIELHPFWPYPILDQTTLNHGYKLHQKKANPDRIMSLVVSCFDFDSAGLLNPTTQSRIKMEIQRFWDGRTTETHRFVNASE